MFAQVISQYGGFDVVDHREVETPTPGPGEIRVRVAYVSVNAIEWKILSGMVAEMLPQTFPLILGNEISGIVDHVGDGEHDLRVGDRVTGFARGGGDAEYVLTTPDRVAVVPAELPLRDAVTIPQGVETARRALEELGVQDGETVLVNGAAGSIGSAAPSLGVPITMGAGPHELFADSFRDVLPLAAKGRFATEIAAEFPLTELTAAWKLNQDGHFRGKIIVKVADLD